MSTALGEPPLNQEVEVALGTTEPVPRTHHPWRRFTRHYFEMFVVMWIGMFIAAFVFMTILTLAVAGEVTWEEALVDYPAHALLAIAIGMSVPMIPWMRHRGHTRRSAYEMAAVMAIPVIPFVCLALLNVVDGAQCGLYCLVGILGMFVLMLYRREEYGVDVPLSRSFARFNRNVANPFMRLLAGWVPPFSIVNHHGRRTARAYATPAWAFRTQNGLVFAALYGPDSDWIRNVLAADHAQVKRLGKTRDYGQARLIESNESMRLVPRISRPVFQLFRVRAFLEVKEWVLVGDGEKQVTVNKEERHVDQS